MPAPPRNQIYPPSQNSAPRDILPPTGTSTAHRSSSDPLPAARLSRNPYERTNEHGNEQNLIPYLARAAAQKDSTDE